MWLPSFSSCGRTSAPKSGTAADGGGADFTTQKAIVDELVFEVDAGSESQLEKQVRKHMRGAADLQVELVVDVGVGDNWDEAH